MKKLFYALFVPIIMLTVMLSITAHARDAYLVYENFDDNAHAFEQVSANGSKCTLTVVNADNNGYALNVKQNSGYAHVGTAVKIKKDVTYSFSFDIKAVSYADGSSYASGKNLTLCANFVFTDANASNQKKNHVISLSALPADGKWHTYQGTYTAKSSVVAADADIDNTHFSVYLNPADSKNHIFMIDNVKVTYTDNEPNDGVNYFANGSFEDTDNIEVKSANGTSCIIEPGNIDASDGIYSIKVTSNGNYGHIGIPVKLEAERTYEFSYDYKLIGDNAGGSASSNVSFYTNFVFTDSKASSGRNHLITAGSANSSTGWIHVDGSYTPSTSSIAADANLENGYFTIYSNPVNGKGAVWLIDNVTLIRKPLEAEEDTVTLPAIISDNMLIQKGMPIPVWGTFVSENSLTVTLKEGETVLSTASAASKAGSFDMTLPAVDRYVKSAVLVFESGGKVIETVENVAVGELWHFSGQSNMASVCSKLSPGIYPESNMPDIRYYNSGDAGAGTWRVANISNLGSFSAIAYKTMETIYGGLDGNVPIGGINTSVGGKAMSSYIGVSEYSSTGGDLYKSRVAPITKVPVKGHFWYQGESDTRNTNFVNYFSALISSWRTAWNDASQPFIFVQLPRSCATIPDWWGGLDENGLPTKTSTYNYSKVHMWQYEAFRKLENDNVYMAVTIDTTTKIDPQKSIENMSAEDPLHPRNKAPIGIRLGNIALAEVYGKTDVKHEFPMPSDFRLDGRYIKIKYEGVYDGLATTNGNNPVHFEIIDENGNYITPDKVKITAPDTIILWSDSVTAPSGVSYFHEEHFVDMSGAFAELYPTLTNSESLPAAPFTYMFDGSEEACGITAASTLDTASIRLTSPIGIRYVCFVPEALRLLDLADEYGFIVVSEETVSAAYPGDTAFDCIKFDDNGSKNGYLDDGKTPYVSAYTYKKGADDYSEKLTVAEAEKIFPSKALEGITGDGYYFTVVLTHIPENAYGKKLVGKPYIKIDGTYYYGKPVNKSIYEVAVILNQKYTSEGKAVPETVSNIISTVEDK